jgi:hypothetical protein
VAAAKLEYFTDFTPQRELECAILEEYPDFIPQREAEEARRVTNHLNASPENYQLEINQGFPSLLHLEEAIRQDDPHLWSLNVDAGNTTPDDGSYHY